MIRPPWRWWSVFRSAGGASLLGAGWGGWPPAITNPRFAGTTGIPGSGWAAIGYTVGW